MTNETEDTEKDYSAPSMNLLEAVRWGSKDYSWLLDGNGRASRSEFFWLVFVWGLLAEITTSISTLIPPILGLPLMMAGTRRYKDINIHPKYFLFVWVAFWVVIGLENTDSNVFGGLIHATWLQMIVLGLIGIFIVGFCVTLIPGKKGCNDYDDDEDEDDEEDDEDEDDDDDEDDESQSPQNS